MMNKQEILKAIRVCAKKLGHSPSLRELRRLAGVNGTRLDKEFGSLSKALAAAGLEAVGSGFEAAESALLLDWAAVVRKLGRIPTAQLYDKNGKFSLGPFYTRYERWGRVMEAFKKFARRKDRDEVEGRIAADYGAGRKDAAHGQRWKAGVTVSADDGPRGVWRSAADTGNGACADQ